MNENKKWVINSRITTYCITKKKTKHIWGALPKSSFIILIDGDRKIRTSWRFLLKTIHLMHNVQFAPELIDFSFACS